MSFLNAKEFQIDRSTFNEAQGDISYHIQRNYNQHINVHDGDQDIRSRVYSVMKPHIYTDAFHDSGARRDPSSCYPGTRTKALQTISHWIEDPAASHCLWLHGPAGTGKSVIAQTFAQQCRRDQTLGASYFFTKGSISGPPPLFSTLVYQLMLAVPGLDDHLWEVIVEDQTVFQRSMTEQLDKLIVRPFLKLVDRPAYIVIVIDGLDECDGTAAQGEIVRLILGLQVHSLPLRFLIASRPEPNIRRSFESPLYSPPVYLPLNASLDSDRDIRHFLCKELERIYKESVEDGMLVMSQATWPSSRDIDQLVRKSSGHFIYASTVIKFVQEERANPIERLKAVLQISSASAGPSVFVQSTAFQELDQLYLHILRKAGDPPELARILRAIVYFGDKASPGNLDTIFSRTGGVSFLLRDLHSIIQVTSLKYRGVRFLHASLNDFFMDAARSREFHLNLGQFEADLAYEYTRLIMSFSLTESWESWDSLTMAMIALEDCLQGTRAHSGLLSTTLEKLAIVIDEGPKSPLPCICYSGLDFLLRTFKTVPESGSLCKKLKTIRRQYKSQLTALSTSIFILVHVLGIYHVVSGSPTQWAPFAFMEAEQLIDVPNGPEIIQQTLGLDLSLHYITSPSYMARLHPRAKTPIMEVYQSLSGWLFARRQPKGAWGFIIPAVWGILRPLPQIAVEKYTWAWAWDTTALLPDWGGIIQPLKHIPLGESGLERTSLFIGDHFDPMTRLYDTPDPILLRVYDGIDFTSISRALPTLSIEFYPRLFYLNQAFDRRLNGVHMTNRNTSLRRCLRNIYSHLVQDPIISRAVSVIYAMFQGLSPKDIELLLGHAPGELFHSPAMQALFGVGVLRADDKELTLSTWLPLQLKNGSVKLQHDAPNKLNYDVDDHIRNAHEHLAFACIEYLLSCPDPTGIKRSGRAETAGSYAMKYWTSHVRRAKHSERLFHILRRVVIYKDNVEPVLEWLKRGAETPRDVLLRWHIARLEHGTNKLWNPDPDESFFYQYASIRDYRPRRDSGTE